MFNDFNMVCWNTIKMIVDVVVVVRGICVFYRFWDGWYYFMIKRNEVGHITIIGGRYYHEFLIHKTIIRSKKLCYTLHNVMFGYSLP